MVEEKFVIVKDEDETHDSFSVERHEQWMALPVEQRVSWYKNRWVASSPSVVYEDAGSLPHTHELYPAFRASRAHAVAHAARRTADVYRSYIKAHMPDYVHNTQDPEWTPCPRTIALVGDSILSGLYAIDPGFRVAVGAADRTRDTFYPRQKSEAATSVTNKVRAWINSRSEATARLFGGGEILVPEVKPAFYVNERGGAEVTILGDLWFVTAK